MHCFTRMTFECNAYYFTRMTFDSSWRTRVEREKIWYRFCDLNRWRFHRHFCSSICVSDSWSKESAVGVSLKQHFFEIFFHNFVGNGVNMSVNKLIFNLITYVDSGLNYLCWICAFPTAWAVGGKSFECTFLFEQYGTDFFLVDSNLLTSYSKGNVASKTIPKWT